MSMLTIDTAFDYEGLHDHPARCHLRIFAQGDGEAVLLVTDLGDDNPGASVTNTIERIVTQAVARYGLDSERVTVIEHYDTRRVPGAPPRRDDGEDFDMVTFERVGAEFRTPSWRPIRKQQAEAIIGQPLP